MDRACGTVLAAVLLTIALPAASCWRGPPDTQNVDLTLSQLQSFADFSVYWVGEEFLGYPLDRIIGPYPDGFQSPVLVVYGTCGTAFETGCSPPLVIKTAPRCIRNLSEPTKVRGRMAGMESRRPVIQAGDVSVTIYASEELQASAAENMIVANAAAAPPHPSVVPGGPLPGSICELERLNPRFPREQTSPSPTAEETGENGKVATVFAAFGEFETVNGFDEAEAKLGWRVLRSDDPRFTVEGYAVAALRKFKNPLFRLEQQRYSMVGHRYPIQMSQEPESYPDVDSESAGGWDDTIGRWTGQLRSGGDWLAFVFFSGESINGQRIRVWVETSHGYTREELEAFVESLDFGP